MTLDEILKSTMQIEEDIIHSRTGAPALATAIDRLRGLEAEVERIRGLQGPLIPDATRPPTDDEQSAEGLARTIRSLVAAARAKQGA